MGRTRQFGNLLRLFLPPHAPPVVRPQTFLTYEEIARFQAAVFIPWSPETYSFREFYSMELPLFVPNASWLLRCAFVHYERYERLPVFEIAQKARNKTGGPYGRDQWRWLRWVDYLLVPGVTYFASLQELAKQLSGPLPSALPQRAYMRRAMINAKAFWLRAFPGLAP